MGRHGIVQAPSRAAAKPPAAGARVRLLAAGLGGALALLLPAAVAPGAARATVAAGTLAWSAPATLASGCYLAGAPRVAFPSEAPNVPTGPGGIVWAADHHRCPAADSGAAAAAAPASVTVAALTGSGRPAAPRTHLLPAALAGPLAAEGASFGRVAAVVGLAGAAPTDAAAAVLQGAATHGLGAPRLAQPGAPVAFARAYLGDVAIATATAGAIVVRVQRHYQPTFGRPQRIPIAAGNVTALTATMDFRSDVLLAWEQNGAVYAHMLRASGRTDPTQRLGESAPAPQLHALVSDNDHGMVVWSSTQQAAGATTTGVYVDLSKAGVSFPAPRLLTAFRDPAAVGPRPGSLALVRLARENVVMAWTDVQGGHYVVRSAPAVYAASRPATLLSDPRRQSVLAGLAPGPANEAIAMWTSPPGRAAGQRAPRGELWAARTVVLPGDRVAGGAARRVATPGAGAEVGLGVDPASDRTLAAWLAPAAGRIEYAVSSGASGYRPLTGSSPVRAPRSGVHWLRITAGVLAALALLAVGVALWKRRAGRQPAGG